MRILLVPPTPLAHVACDPLALAEALRADGHAVSIAPTPQPGLWGGGVAAYTTARALGQQDRCIVCEQSGAALGAWCARWLTRKPYALLLTHTNLPRYRRWPVWPGVLRSVFKRAAAVAVFNSATRDTLIKHGVRRQVLTLCAPPTQVVPVPGTSNATMLVYAGTMPSMPHTSGALVRVLGHVLEKVPQARMRVIAPQGDPALDARTAIMGLEANLSTIDALPAGARGVVLAYAAFGETPSALLAIQAMGTGLPIAAARHAVLSDWLRDGETALTFTLGDEAAAADAVARLLTDTPLAERLASAAQERAKARHTWEILRALLLGT